MVLGLKSSEGRKCALILKSPMLQVLSNNSLKVFFITTPNFCLGGYGPPRPPPAPPQLRRLGYNPSSSSS